PPAAGAAPPRPAPPFPSPASPSASYSTPDQYIQEIRPDSPRKGRARTNSARPRGPALRPPRRGSRWELGTVHVRRAPPLRKTDDAACRSRDVTFCEDGRPAVVPGRLRCPLVAPPVPSP